MLQWYSIREDAITSSALGSSGSIVYRRKGSAIFFLIQSSSSNEHISGTNSQRYAYTKCYSMTRILAVTLTLPMPLGEVWKIFWLRGPCFGRNCDFGNFYLVLYAFWKSIIYLAWIKMRTLAWIKMRTYRACKIGYLLGISSKNRVEQMYISRRARFSCFTIIFVAVETVGEFNKLYFLITVCNNNNNMMTCHHTH